ncbi:MAG: hypothetical protein Phyf2KO_24000 [Phycisphaerales bacterium]
MNTESRFGAHAPVIAALGLPLILSAQAAGQIDTREWLLPKSGYWSDPANWSESNVPDTLNEFARLSPSPERIGDGALGEALIDQHIEVVRVYANGLIDIRVAPGATLDVRTTIAGEEGNIATVYLGDYSTSGETAELRFGSIRSGLTDAIVEMADLSGGAVIEVNRSLFSDTSVVRGIGEIRDGDTLTNEGRIESVQIADGTNVLRIGETKMINRGSIRAGFRSQLLVENTWIDSTDGGEFTSEGNLLFIDSEIVGGVLNREGRGSVTVLGETVFDLVDIDPISIDVEGELLLRGGELDNNGFIDVAHEGTLNLEGDTQFTGEGRVSFWRSDEQIRIVGQEEAVLTNGAGHLIEGRGQILAGLENRGALAILGQEAPSHTLRIRGQFEQTNEGTLELIARDYNGQFGLDRLLIDRNSAILGGTLNYRLLGLVGDTVGQPHTIIRVIQNDPSQQIVGTFDSVAVLRSTSARDISQIVEIDYLPDRVNLTWYCKADVNRNGVVEPTDFKAWINAFNNGDPLADINENGNLTLSDFNAWVFQYNRPCGR